MNLKGLFQRLRMPSKSGKNLPVQEDGRSIQRHFLEFKNIEGSPKYPLTETITVGSETGDVVIEEPSLAAHHASFSLKDGLVTVQDLGSEGRTILADHSLETGKSVILRKDDEVSLGDLLVRLVIEEEIVEAPKPKIIAAPAADKTSIIKRPHAEADDKLQKRLSEVRQKPKDKKLKTNIIAAGSSRAANMLPRAVGFVFDILWVLILWQLLSPYPEVTEILKFVPETLSAYVLPFIDEQVKVLGVSGEYHAISADLAELWKEFGKEFHLAELLSLLLVWRLLTTFMFGVTLGSWTAGVSAYGNVAWKRIGGVLRELLGWALRPFILADLPALFSRRTLQELITFTHLFSPSKGSVFILWLLFGPILVVGVLIAPVFTGFELPQAIVITDSASRAVVADEELEEGQEPPVRVLHSSQWFESSFALAAAEWSMLPRFSWGVQNEKRSLLPSLVFYHANGTMLPLTLQSRFSWQELLNKALAHNPPLQAAFPGLWGWAQSSTAAQGGVIKFNPNAGQRLSLQTELSELIRVVFSITPDRMIEHSLEYGPLFKGPVDFRHKLLGLVGASEEGSWTLRRFAKNLILVYESSGPKPYDLLIPLSYGEGRIFKIAFASPLERAKTNKLINRLLWPHSSWTLDVGQEVKGAPLVIDVLANLIGHGQLEEAQVEQVYQFFFESAVPVVALPLEDVKKSALIASLNNLIEVVERVSKSKSLKEAQLQLLEKLRTKLVEVKGRVESGDASFFGATTEAPTSVAPLPPVKKAP